MIIQIITYIGGAFLNKKIAIAYNIVSLFVILYSYCLFHSGQVVFDLKNLFASHLLIGLASLINLIFLIKVKTGDKEL